MNPVVLAGRLFVLFVYQNKLSYLLIEAVVQIGGTMFKGDTEGNKNKIEYHNYTIVPFVCRHKHNVLNVYYIRVYVFIIEFTTAICKSYSSFRTPKCMFNLLYQLT
jgi:hypothetical protein